MNLREIPPLHEIAKLEHKFKLLFFLMDIGVSSAKKPAVAVWDLYVTALSSIATT